MSAPERPALATLTLEQIAEADDRPEISVPVPEWNGVVSVRGLTYDQLQQAREKSWDKRLQETSDEALNAHILTLGLVAPAITFAVAVQWMQKRAFGPVNLILGEVLNATGLGKKAVEAAKSPAPDAA